MRLLYATSTNSALIQFSMRNVTMFSYEELTDIFRCFKNEQKRKYALDYLSTNINTAN